MTSFTDVFSNSLVPPTKASFASYVLTENSQFQWAYNYSGTDRTLANSNEISCSAGVVMVMPTASEVSNGETVIIKNVGSETLTIVKSDTTALTTIEPGEIKYLQVIDNTDEGVWSLTTFGTGTSSADAIALAGKGLSVIGSVLNAAYHTEVQSDAWNITPNDRAKVFIFTGGSSVCSLNTASSFGSNFFCMVRNSGTGSLKIDPSGSQLIDGGLELVLNPGESVILTSDGINWYTIGYGRSTIYQFTQLVKTVVSGEQTLTAVESGNKLLTFIGSPDDTATVVVPSVVSIYYIHNDISTAQNIIIKTTDGTGATIPQGQRAIVFCDGTDVLAAQTAEISGDISLTDGAYSSPSLRFSSQTNTGIYKHGSHGIGFSANGVAIGGFNPDGFSVLTGYLKLPSSNSPSQIEEGAMVWDDDSDLLTIGTGSGRLTFLDTTTATALLNQKANLNSPSFTGTVSGITKSMVGLSNVDNTSDANKPISTATQTALNSKFNTSATTDLEMNNYRLFEIKTAVFNSELDAGNSGTSKTINWADGQFQKLTLTGNVTLVFNWAGCGVGRYQLKLIQDATGSRTITWSTGTPSSTRWLESAAAPAHKATANSETIVTVYYDGTNAYGSMGKVGG